MSTVRDVGQPPAAPALTDITDRFLNRELSQIDFNARVLTLAEAEDAPLLERAKFLAIFATNTDEFFQVRVAGLKQPTGSHPLSSCRRSRPRSSRWRSATRASLPTASCRRCEQPA